MGFTNQETKQITNRDFLNAIFSEPPPDLGVWIANFDASPQDKEGVRWGGGKYPISKCPDFKSQNAYFSVSLFKLNDPTPARRMDNAHSMCVLVLDDSEGVDLEPSWMLETSPGNYQTGYILNTPITDMQLARRLLKEITNKSYVNSNDSSGNNPVRYVRLPIGCNTKNDEDFKHVLVEFDPSRRYSLDEMISALSLDRAVVMDGNAPKQAKSFDSFGGINPSELTAIIQSSEHFHDPMRNLIAHNLGRGVDPQQVKFMAQGLMLSIPEDQRRANWKNDFDDIEHMIKGGVDKNFGNRTVLGMTVDMATGEIKAPKNYQQMYGDIYNGQVFAEMFRGRFLFCHSSKLWYQWTGIYWQGCGKNEHQIAAKEASQELVLRAAEEFTKNPTGAETKVIQINAKQTLNNNKRDDMLRSATTEPGMSISSSGELDADPMLLGVRNGVLNLRNGALVEPDPKMLISKQAGVDYDRDAKAPMWEKFISETFLGDQDQIHYIQKALGYSLTGDVSEEVSHFCYGSGNNGKTLMTNIMYGLLGDYAAIVDTDVLMRSDNVGNSAASPELARLQGIRFGVANEVEEGRRLNDKNLKKLASKQAITARELYGRIFEFMPTLKLWITTNHKPFVSDQTDGAWRRIRLVEFNNRLTKEQVDYELEDKLLSEKSGILNWLLEGCQIWIKERLEMTRQIEKAGNDYRSESDVLGTFIEEHCDVGPEFKVTHKDLFANWRSWCNENNHIAGAKNGLTRKLDVRGISSKGWLDGRRAYTGIKLNKSSAGFD